MSVEVRQKLRTRKNFIADWAEVGLGWGMSRSMAAIHAYLLTADKLVTADELVEELELSRGCVSTNLSQLVKYGFIEKAEESHRKDYFRAEKNTFSILQSVISYRREKELAPLLKLLDHYCPSQLSDEIPQDSVEMICDIRQYAMKTDRFLTNLENSNESLFVRSFLRMI